MRFHVSHALLHANLLSLILFVVRWMDALIVLLPTAQYLRGQQHLGKGGELSQQGGTPRCATTVCMFQQPGERGRKKKEKSHLPLKFLCLCVCQSLKGRMCTCTYFMLLGWPLVHLCPTSNCSSHAVHLRGLVSFHYLCECVLCEL